MVVSIVRCMDILWLLFRLPASMAFSHRLRVTIIIVIFHIWSSIYRVLERIMRAQYQNDDLVLLLVGFFGQGEYLGVCMHPRPRLFRQDFHCLVLLYDCGNGVFLSCGIMTFMDHHFCTYRDLYHPHAQIFNTDDMRKVPRLAC